MKKPRGVKLEKPELIRNRKVYAYITADEGKAYDSLTAKYGSGGEAIRQALALLIRSEHSELIPLLRADLQTP